MKILISVAMLLFLFISCKKQNTTIASPINDVNANNVNMKKNNSQISKEDDYLYFKDGSVFNSTLEKLENMSENEINLWESNFNGFQSMNNKFIENLILDTMHFWRKQYIELVPQNIKVNHTNEIKDFNFMYVKYFFDRTTNQYEEYTNEGMSEEEYLLVKNISIESYAFVVNPHGIVRIGDSLYQFTRNLTKSIKATTPGKANKLINAKLNNSNGNNEVVFRTHGNIPSVNKVGSCSPPSYYYDNAWGTSNLVEFSSNPKFKLYLYGGYRFTNDYYCQALYTPIVTVYADSYKKSWYNVQWIQNLATKTLQISYSANNPDGTTLNEYSYAPYNNVWRAQYLKSFPQLNSQTYSNMFTVTNFFARATMSGGSSGGAVTISR